jgi:hypothetical protein
MYRPRSFVLLKTLGVLVTAIVFVAGIPVALLWIRQAMPLLLALVIPIGAIGLALGLFRRRW